MIGLGLNPNLCGLLVRIDQAKPIHVLIFSVPKTKLSHQALVLESKFRQDLFRSQVLWHRDGLDSIKPANDPVFKSKFDNFSRRFGGDPFSPMVRSNVVTNVATVVSLVKSIQAAAANQFIGVLVENSPSHRMVRLKPMRKFRDHHLSLLQIFELLKVVVVNHVGVGEQSENSLGVSRENRSQFELRGFKSRNRIQRYAAGSQEEIG